MTTLEQRILSSTSQRVQVLKTLAESDYAASALQQNTTYLKDLNDEVRVRSRQVAMLSQAKIKELSDHEKYQKSTMRRLGYKLGGKKEKFIAKAEKEERVYFEAVQALFQAEQTLALLKDNLAKAESAQQELKPVVARHDAAQVDLENLYNSIFEGPTPEFPEEDAKERPVSTTKQAYNEAQLRLDTETQVHAILQDALKYITGCSSNLLSALRASDMDTWGFGGRYADMAERSSLAKAQGLASQVEMLISQAQRLQPLVQNIGPMNIAKGHVMGDIIFDNIFSDMKFDKKIWDSKSQVTQATRKLNDQIGASAERLKALRLETNQARSRLDAARDELLQVRAAAFEQVIGAMPALPAYSE